MYDVNSDKLLQIKPQRFTLFCDFVPVDDMSFFYIITFDSLEN